MTESFEPARPSEPDLPLGEDRTQVLAREDTPRGEDRTQVLAREAAPEPAADSQSDNPLPVGYVLQEYVIEGLIGVGGLGSVYRARPTQLGGVVPLK